MLLRIHLSLLDKSSRISAGDVSLLDKSSRISAGDVLSGLSAGDV